MIPKTIHYCWFGRNPKPELAEKCIRSWKKYCPDYAIIEWNEDNFDLSAAPLYVRQAYEAKKWAFVTDYVRLWAMYTYGGIYMDTDVQVIKPLDRFLQYEALSGFESETQIQTGLMACREGFPLFGELLHEYDEIAFINEDGSLDLTTNVLRITALCSKYGFVPNGQQQTFAGFTIFPVEYFCPLVYDTGKLHKTKNTYTIHWFSASWWNEQQRKEHKIMQKKLRFFRFWTGIIGEKAYYKIKHLLKRG